MELTFESAFSSGGLVGHASYFLLVVSMMMRNINLLRILVIASAIFGIAYDIIWLTNPIGVFWETALLVVNLVQLSIVAYLSRRARFNPEERRFLAAMLPDLPRHQARKLLNLGHWISGEARTRLTTEGEPVSHLFYISEGEAEVFSGGYRVATCKPQSFIGEMTCLSGEPASGTVILSKPSRYLIIEAEALRNISSANEDIQTALEATFGGSLRDKLIATNQTMARATVKNA